MRNKKKILFQSEKKKNPFVYWKIDPLGYPIGVIFFSSRMHLYACAMVQKLNKTMTRHAPQAWSDTLVEIEKFWGRKLGMKPLLADFSSWKLTFLGKFRTSCAEKICPVSLVSQTHQGLYCSGKMSKTWWVIFLVRHEYIFGGLKICQARYFPTGTAFWRKILSKTPKNTKYASENFCVVSKHTLAPFAPISMTRVCHSPTI